MALGLALSGGGFRATIFHLGVVRFLRDSGLLREVKAVCSVSGGSILAGHLIAYWPKYTGHADEFNDVLSEIRRLTSFGLRNRIVRRLPFLELYRLLRFLRFLPSFNETALLAHYYRTRLLDRVTLQTLRNARLNADAPRLCIMTTNLTRLDNTSYFSEEGFFVDASTNPNRVSADAMKAADAVAASSAYPGLFRPMSLTNRTLHVREDQFQPPRQDLTDGGIFDNLGLRKLRSLREELGLDHLIICDAGGEIDWDTKTRYESSRLRTLLRCTDIWQFQVNRNIDFETNEHLVSIGEVIDFTFAPGVPPVETQRDLARIRTDLDEFSPFEFWCLYNHGYCVAARALAGLTEGRAPAQHPHVPYQRDGIELENLAGASRRRLRIWDSRDWVSWVYLLLIPALIFGVVRGVPYLADRAVAAVHWLAEKNRATYRGVEEKSPAGRQARVVPCHPETEATTLGATLFKHEISGEAKALIERLIRGYADGLPPDQRILIIEQSGEFAEDYRSFPVGIRFDSNTRVADGKIFLFRSATAGSAPAYRELPTSRDIEGRLEETVTVLEPNKGEFLVLLIKVEAAYPKSPFPPADGQYHFSLEVR